MKYSWFFLALVIVLQLCISVDSRKSGRSHHHKGSHHRVTSRGSRIHARYFGKQGRAGPVLPPPTSDSEESDEARGLRGQANVLASLQKSLAKCIVEGSYGIQGECSKYTDCAKAGLIPTSKYCPSGKFFDHLQRICVKSSDAQCKDVCKEDGIMMADPNNPNGYLQCINRVPMPHMCPDPKSVFSTATKACGDASTSSSSESDETER